MCSDPRFGVYDARVCGWLRAGIPLSSNLRQVCRADEPLESAELCAHIGGKIWRRVQRAANAANADCEFTTFVGYEYTLGSVTTQVRHRNVIFASDRVPDRPLSRYEMPTPIELWNELRRTCEPADGCEVIAIPHNSNRSEGLAFASEGLTAVDATLRADLEPVVEIFQHKGSSECYPLIGNDDPECAFERLYAKRSKTDWFWSETSVSILSSWDSSAAPIRTMPSAG